ncbi:helix-turn-helix transcriptional regulator [Novosphingobium sp.]|uniref:helix-turn-helix transcriptional regulator n=1 Tax=Novosphingobium sp. TaxID=1874826 RepID=UPI0038BB09F7
MSELTDYIRLSRSQIYVLMSRGDFVTPIKLGERAIGWKVDEVDAWVSSRPTARVA